MFDDSLAASRRQKGIVQKLPRAQQRHFDRHLVGRYNRYHGRGGQDFWVYGLNGITNEPIGEVRF